MTFSFERLRELRWEVLSLLSIPLGIWIFYSSSLRLHFWADDFGLVGPLGADLLLHHQGDFFKTVLGSHYAPLIRYWYGILALLWGTNPAPYHLASLVIACLASLALFRLLRVYQFAPFPSLLAALYFALSVSNFFTMTFIALAAYYLLALAWAGALICWERFLRSGSRGAGAGAAALAVGGSLIHALGVAIPLFFLLRFLLLEKGERRGGRSGVWRYSLGLFAVTLAINLIPRLIFSLPRPPSAYRFGAFDLPLALWYSLSRNIIPNLWGQLNPSPGPFQVPSLVLLVLTQMAVASLVLLWLRRRSQWRFALFSLAFPLVGWSMPYLLIGWPPETFFLKTRYMLVPNIGFSCLLAVLGQSAQLEPRPWLRRIGITAAGLFLCLFLFQNWVATRICFGQIQENDRWVWSVARDYKAALEDLHARVPRCAAVVAWDVPVKRAWPGDPGENLLFLEMAHTNLQSFWYPKWEGPPSIRYISGPEEAGSFPEDCRFTAFGGRLYPGFLRFKPRENGPGWTGSFPARSPPDS